MLLHLAICQLKSKKLDEKWGSFLLFGRGVHKFTSAQLKNHFYIYIRLTVAPCEREGDWGVLKRTVGSPETNNIYIVLHKELQEECCPIWVKLPKTFPDNLYPHQTKRKKLFF